MNDARTPVPSWIDQELAAIGWRAAPEHPAADPDLAPPNAIGLYANGRRLAWLTLVPGGTMAGFYYLDLNDVLISPVPDYLVARLGPEEAARDWRRQQRKLEAWRRRRSTRSRSR